MITIQGLCIFASYVKNLKSLTCSKILKKLIKAVKLNRGGEYYDRYIETKQMLRPFALLFKEYDIVP